MRAFIAIGLPAEIKNTLSEIQENLKIEQLKLLSSEILPSSRGRMSNLRAKEDNSRKSISWVKPQNLHLTLKFLGDISSVKLNEIKQAITEITKTAPGFKVRLEAAGVFPGLHAARIIWIGADQAPLALNQLAEELETRLSASGIHREQRDFRPHITIARIKTRLNPSDLKKAVDKIGENLAEASWEFDCREITLFESALGPTGPTYTILDQFNLKIT